MRAIGKTLQIVGLALPPLGIVAQLSNAVSLGQMLAMLLAGVCAFYLGRMMEGYAR